MSETARKSPKRPYRTLPELVKRKPKRPHSKEEFDKFEKALKEGNSHHMACGIAKIPYGRARRRYYQDAEFKKLWDEYTPSQRGRSRIYPR